MRLSQRLPDDLEPSPLSANLRRLAGDATVPALIDLTETNPTRAGLVYPDGLFAALADAEVRTYAPEPTGLASARRALAIHLGLGADAADSLVLTSSTSEAYAILFKILCDPGDAIAVPAPSYPLFEHLARLEGVRVVPYRLTYAGRWQIDLDSLASALTAGVRAVVVVAPNNPTGSSPSPSERQALHAMCRAHDVPLVSDEVFRTYGFATDLPTLTTMAALPSLAAPGDDGACTVVLDGLSKRFALPQLKLAWMHLSGDRAACARLHAALEWACDAYLSVSTPVQVALPSLLAAENAVAGPLRDRVRRHRALLAEALAPIAAAELLVADGGWSAVVRLPRILADDAWVTVLAERHRVLVQPGYFYDFAVDGHLVVSLLPEPAQFAAGVARLCHGIAAELAR